MSEQTKQNIKFFLQPIITSTVILIIQTKVLPMIDTILKINVSIKSLLIIAVVILLLFLWIKLLNKKIDNNILKYRKDEYKGNILTWEYKKNGKNYEISNLAILCNYCNSYVSIEDEYDDMYVLCCDCNNYLMEISIEEYNSYLDNAKEKLYNNISDIKLKNKVASFYFTSRKNPLI